MRFDRDGTVENYEGRVNDRLQLVAVLRIRLQDDKPCHDDHIRHLVPQLFRHLDQPDQHAADPLRGMEVPVARLETEEGCDIRKGVVNLRRHPEHLALLALDDPERDLSVVLPVPKQVGLDNARAGRRVGQAKNAIGDEFRHLAELRDGHILARILDRRLVRSLDAVLEVIPHLDRRGFVRFLGEQVDEFMQKEVFLDDKELQLARMLSGLVRDVGDFLLLEGRLPGEGVEEKGEAVAVQNIFLGQ